MIYQLKDCRTGEKAVYKTTVEITEKEDILTFRFTAENCQFYCPYPFFNGIHTEGDAFEIIIGSDPNKKCYYELEISPLGDVMQCEMHYHGRDEEGEPILDWELLSPPFAVGKAEKTENGYISEISFDKKNISKAGEEIYFNVFRTETDGGEMEKHLFALNPTMMGKFHIIEKYLPLKDYVNK